MSLLFFTVDSDDVELQKDGTYRVEMWLDEVFEEIDDLDLEEEADKRGLLHSSNNDESDDYTREDFLREVQSMNADEFRRLLCDMTGNMYCVSDDKLLDDIKCRL